VRKPREPSEKAMTGGTMRWKSQLAKRTVPSPPSYATNQNLFLTSRYMKTVFGRTYS